MVCDQMNRTVILPRRRTQPVRTSRLEALRRLHNRYLHHIGLGHPRWVALIKAWSNT